MQNVSFSGFPPYKKTYDKELYIRIKILLVTDLAMLVSSWTVTVLTQFIQPSRFTKTLTVILRIMYFLWSIILLAIYLVDVFRCSIRSWIIDTFNEIL